MGYYAAMLKNFTKTGFRNKIRGKIKNIKDILDVRLFTGDENLERQFQIIYKSITIDENLADRIVSYECENQETACYIAAKIKT